MNSINWARVMAQIVYYVTAHRAVTGGDGPIAFSVPTGNFGNVFAGWVALQMGVPIEQLVVGSNRNDILPRWLDSGTMAMAEVLPTFSPSMDIQVSSNLERLLFEVFDHDGAAVADLLGRFRSDRSVDLPTDRMRRVRAVFDGARLDDEETLGEIRSVHDSTGLLIDPHTAVGVGAARAARRDRGLPMVVLGTADPAKFPDAVEQATGIRPPLPEWLSDLHDRPEHVSALPNDLAAVRSFVIDRTQH
jgi:threonine synthase